MTRGAIQPHVLLDRYTPDSNIYLEYLGGCLTLDSPHPGKVVVRRRKFTKNSVGSTSDTLDFEPCVHFSPECRGSVAQKLAARDKTIRRCDPCYPRYYKHRAVREAAANSNLKNTRKCGQILNQPWDRRHHDDPHYHPRDQQHTRDKN